MPMTFAQETHPIASHGTDYLLIIVLRIPLPCILWLYLNRLL